MGDPGALNSGAPRRIVVTGMSGAGKSTLARLLAQRLGAPHAELDALFWGPEWEPRMPAEFRASVQRVVEGERWVVDGNYGLVRPLVWPRAEAIVWLNLPFATVLTRVAMRTARRIVRRETLWGHNRETLARTFLSRESILHWVITAYRRKQREFTALMGSPDFPQVRWLEMRRTPRDADEVLARLAAMSPGTHAVVR